LISKIIILQNKLPNLKNVIFENENGRNLMGCPTRKQHDGRNEWSKSSVPTLWWEWYIPSRGNLASSQKSLRKFLMEHDVFHWHHCANLLEFTLASRFNCKTTSPYCLRCNRNSYLWNWNVTFLAHDLLYHLRMLLYVNG
jgi:hypothetical protein